MPTDPASPSPSPAQPLEEFVQWLADGRLSDAASEEADRLASRSVPEDSRQGDDGDWPLVGTLRRLDRYELLGVLGSGAYGAAFLARDLVLQREVVVKALRAHAFTNAQLRSSCLHEARSLAQLNHDCIARVFDCGETADGLCYLVAEYRGSETLEQRLKQGALRWEEACSIATDIAEALDHAHQRGLVHRDVKPSNIVIDRGRGVLIDFGIALDDAQVSLALDVRGTPFYLSPEQAAGRGGAVDGRSDIFSLGIVLYEMLCGRRPFRGAADQLAEQVQHLEPKPPRQYVPAIPEPVEAVCLRMLAKAPADRYASARDLATALRRCGTASRVRRQRRWVAMGAMLVCGTLGAWRLASDHAEERPDANGTVEVEGAPRQAERQIRPSAPNAAASEACTIVDALPVAYERAPGGEYVVKGSLATPDAPRVFTGDAIRLTGHLSRAAHVAVLTLDADGRSRVELSTRFAERPSRTWAFPLPRDAVYALTDGAGVQAVVVVACDAPATALAADLQEAAANAWSRAAAQRSWAFQRGVFEPLGRGDRRGVIEPLAGIPDPFRAICEEVTRVVDPARVYALAVPVIEAP